MKKEKEKKERPFGKFTGGVRAMEWPPEDRAVEREEQEQEQRARARARKGSGAAMMAVVGILAMSCVGATVTGTLQDIGLGNLNTKITFSPTNRVVVGSSGLVAGPPKTIDSTNGVFVLTLAQGSYTVCLPLVPSRRCFSISVPEGTNSLQITNLLSEGFIDADDGTANGKALQAD